MTAVEWGMVSDVGRARDANQDSAMATGDLFVVADGMGGHNGGEVASATAIEHFRASVAVTSTDELVERVQGANRAIVEMARTDPELAGMGTTVTAIALVSVEGANRIAVANVGDSCTYRFRDGTLDQLTVDHSLVEALVREGRLTAEEALSHPHRNVVTRALGVDEVVEVDTWEHEPYLGDRYVLCSDGLFNEVSGDVIAATLRRLDDPRDVADELVRLANAHGGRDNVTVLVVDVVDAEEPDADAEDRSSEPTGGFPEEASEVTAPQRVVTGRMLAFVVLLLAIVGVAVGGVWYLAWATYFVGEDAGEVVIYRGRPGGVLWFDPVVAERTELRVAELHEVDADAVRSQVDTGDLESARDYVGRLDPNPSG